MVEWWRVLRRKFGGLRIEKIGHIGQLFLSGFLCHHLHMGDDGVVSYLQVGERESERSTLITDRRINERSRHLRG
jgi:hypothetical protein